LGEPLSNNGQSYHPLQTIFYASTQLSNAVALVKGAFEADQPLNLAQKAILKVKQHFKIEDDFDCVIEEGIPSDSGLAGGSSNAAAALFALCKIYELPAAELQIIAAGLGKDVPFLLACHLFDSDDLNGLTAFGSGFGDKIEMLGHLEPSDFEIAINGKSSQTSSKTKEAFAALNLDLCGKQAEKTTELRHLIKEKRPLTQKKLEPLLHNDFAQLYKFGAKEHLSGSGPSTFKLEATSAH
jgi:4-diphosphocytidyl-2-C-methyl-D-erythritol kinase